MKLIGISVDVLKLRKERLYRGEKGLYANIILELYDEPDKKGRDGRTWEKQTEEERANEEKRIFLGDAKILWEGESKKPEAREEKKDDDLPDFLK